MSTKSAALDYLRRGWSAIPVEPGGKRPLVLWRQFQERCPSQSELRSWFARWPDANIGIVTGVISNLLILDIDPRHGGADSLSDLESSHETLPETIEAISGGGGRHIYFEHPGAAVPNRVGLAPGIDLRGDGGVIVAPPSVHPNGRRYKWEVSHHPDDLALAAMPGWLLSLAEIAEDHPGHNTAFWRRLIKQGVKGGSRNNTLASLTGHLLWRDVDPVLIRELLLCWNQERCRPPLSDDEVIRTVESIRRTHAQGRGLNS